MRLSKSFTLNEMVKSQTAEREGINNNPSESQIEALQRLCENILQPVRDHFGMPVTVSSGFRSAQLCQRIGSSINSQHASGQAADFEIFGISNQELAHWIDKNLDYDQMILEFWNPEDKNSGWVHCSYKNPEENRKEFLRAYRDENGKTKYEKYSYIKYAGQQATADEINDMYAEKGI